VVRGRNHVQVRKKTNTYGREGGTIFSKSKTNGGGKGKNKRKTQSRAGRLSRDTEGCSVMQNLEIVGITGKNRGGEGRQGQMEMR